MIVRVWRSRANHEDSAAYTAHFRDQVVPELHRVPGFVGADLLVRAGSLLPRFCAVPHRLFQESSDPI